jgi:hypothetical protein
MSHHPPATPVLLVAALLALAAPPATAQGPGQVDILALNDRVPRPPATLEEAYGRADCAAGRRCSVDRTFARMRAEFENLEQRLHRYMHASSEQGPFAGMDPDALRRRIEAMSMEERIRFARELSRETHPVESPAVRAAMATLDELAERQFELTQRASARAERSLESEIIEMRMRLRDRHEEIDRWLYDELMRIGEPTPDQDPTPFAERGRTARLEAMRRHVAAEEEHLGAVRRMWDEELAGRRALFTPVQRALVAVRYGEDVAGPATRQRFVGTQLQLLGYATRLLEISSAESLHGAAWWFRKLELDAGRTPPW